MDQNTGPCRSTMKLMRKYRTKAAGMSPGLTAKYMITLNAKVTSCDQRKSWILQYFFVIHVEATMERMLPTTPVVMNADTSLASPPRKYFA